MRISSRTKATVAAAVALVAVGGYSAPSQAEPASGGQATGCYKIIKGTASFARHFKVETGVAMQATFEHAADLEDPTGPHPHTENISDGYSREETNDANMSVTVLIDNAVGSDCSGVRYRLSVVDEQGHLVTEVIVPGGATDTVTWNTRFAYPYADGRFADVIVTSETKQGRVVDTSPDDTPVARVNLTSGGATTSFK